MLIKTLRIISWEILAYAFLLCTLIAFHFKYLCKVKERTHSKKESPGTIGAYTSQRNGMTDVQQEHVTKVMLYIAKRFSISLDRSNDNIIDG